MKTHMIKVVFTKQYNFPRFENPKPNSVNDQQNRL